MDQQILSFFAKLAHEKIGIVYADHNYYQLQNRLLELCAKFELTTEELFHKAQIGLPNEILQSYLDIATNNETSFFRDPKVFEAFKKTLPSLTQLPPINGKFRIWSAACSTGQEPFSLAMIFREMPSSDQISAEILASDISTRVLERASRGTYTDLEISRGLPIALKQKYFTQASPNNWEVKPEVRRLVDFRRINLCDSLPPVGPFHFIFCRNILIYQNVERKAETVKKLTRMLVPGGYLVMGAGESMIGISSSFDQSIVDDVILYRIAGRIESAA
jgi:chemotaxis protein methyltransferase CheR